MKPAKPFDCVRMKDEIQTRLAREHSGLTDAQVRRRVLRRLAVSKSPIARLWRSLDAAEVSARR